MLCAIIEEDVLTALMIAVKSGHHKCVSFLVANGALIDAFIIVIEWHELEWNGMDNRLNEVYTYLWF
jgi:hypothetical protein